MLPGFEGDFVVEAVPVLFVCRDVIPLPAVVLPEELFDWEELPPLELSGPETSAELSGALDSVLELWESPELAASELPGCCLLLHPASSIHASARARTRRSKEFAFFMVLFSLCNPAEDLPLIILKMNGKSSASAYQVFTCTSVVFFFADNQNRRAAQCSGSHRR